jgi:hypothetical protein
MSLTSAYALPQLKRSSSSDKQSAGQYLNAKARVERRLQAVRADKDQQVYLQLALQRSITLDKQKRRAAAACRTRDVVNANRAATAGPPCCLRRRQLEHSASLAALRREHAVNVAAARDAAVNAELAAAAQSSSDAACLRRARDAALSALIDESSWRRESLDVRAWATFVQQALRAQQLAHSLAAVRLHRQNKKMRSAIYVILRCLQRATLKRRMNTASDILHSFMSGSRRESPLRIFARKMMKGARSLQALWRSRAACRAAHHAALCKQWDKLMAPAVHSSDNTLLIISNSSSSKTISTSGKRAMASAVAPEVRDALIREWAGRCRRDWISAVLTYQADVVLPALLEHYEDAGGTEQLMPHAQVMSPLGSSKMLSNTIQCVTTCCLSEGSIYSQSQKYFTCTTQLELLNDFSVQRDIG